MMLASLPQPPPIKNDAAPYKYVPYDVLETDWLGDPRRLRAFVDGAGQTEPAARYAPGTLVWVLLSKGKPKQPGRSSLSGTQSLALHRKRRDKKNGRRLGNGAVDGDGIEDAGGSKKDAADGVANFWRNGNEDEDASIDAAGATHLGTAPSRSRKDFFLRARVVSDDDPLSHERGGSRAEERGERRVLVRYSRGATYRVRAHNLIPVLEPEVQGDSAVESEWRSSTPQNDREAARPSGATAPLPPLVVLVPETSIYRRVAKVHVAPGDRLLEIGCDYGITLDKVRRSLEEAGDVPRAWPVEGGGGDDVHGRGADGRVSCLGIDKSVESIEIANERYPKCKFAIGNALVPGEMSSVVALCERSLMGSVPSVICIDINGNREIDGVLECLGAVMKAGWRRRPRMIVVKSRFLYWELRGVGCEGGRAA